MAAECGAGQPDCRIAAAAVDSKSPLVLESAS